ncbi:hypothetical protein BDV28DRAFT_110952 [Aspergillus coremiiformis]|uniref:Polyketide synthase n=1 Tax=Aspergillus coremiiformis TaxID=138285 RepID=A0A5N6Z6H1_9EURO|nr:hypothetical protein BDV28DRAFT_110952 [Aspergillus coremiiformis]
MEKIANSRTSVHTGSFGDDYKAFLTKDPQFGGQYSASSVSPNMIANRISWFFNLRGESLNIDTACSSTLVAFHTACQGLRDGDADVAIVAGANLFLGPDMAMSLNNQGFLSPDGRCWSFDQKANGYGRGEGIGALVLKRLDEALEDNDAVRAVVRATGTNQDGRTPGIVQPSRKAQAELITETYRRAGLDMNLTRYVEAHGTGTPVGDPIEAGAIADAFSHTISKDRPLYIGTVKSNIGHLEGTSGIAGLIKSVLMLERGMVPAIAGLQEVNSTIATRHPNLEFPKKLCPWPSHGLRRLSINSFGFGGTNAHVVMEEFQAHSKLSGSSTIYNVPSSGYLPIENIGYSSSEPIAPKLLVFSSQDEKGIERLQAAYNEHFATFAEHMDTKYLSRLAYTLSDRRSLLLWRAFVFCNEEHDLLKGMKLSRPVKALMAPRLAFCFTGQGAQWFAMGRELSIFDIYSQSIAQSSAVLKGLMCPWSLEGELACEKDISRVNEPEFSQVLCTAVQIALVDLFESVGIQPTVVLGHSSGEIAAAYCTGALDRRSAINVAYYRGLLSSKLANKNNFQGRMLSAGTSAADICSYFKAVETKFGRLSISVGCMNSDNNVTVAGEEKQIDYLEELLGKDGVFARKLNVGVAYHSPQMSEIAGEYFNAMGTLSHRDSASRITMISSVTASIATNSQVGRKEYWVQNMVSPVRFVEALTAAVTSRFSEHDQGVQDKRRLHVEDILEIGPHSALQRPIKDTLKMVTASPTTGYMSTLVKGVNAVNSLFEALGYLHCRGHPVNVEAINSLTSPVSSIPPLLTNLPEYPFDHSLSYWRESRLSKGYRFREAPRNDFLGARVPDWNPQEAKWRKRIKLSEDPWMEDHTIARVNILPAAAMLVLAVEGAKNISRSGANRPIAGYTLKDVSFSRALPISRDPNGTEIEFYLRSSGQAANREQSWSEFRLFYIESDAWVEACRGSIRVSYIEECGLVDKGLEAEKENQKYSVELEKILSSCSRTTDMGRIYKLLAQNGIDFGPAHQVLKNCSYNDNMEALGEVDPNQWKVKGRKHHQADFTIHPTFLDGLFQLGLVVMTEGGAVTSPSVVAGVRKLWIAEGEFAGQSNAMMPAWNKSTFTGLGNTSSTVVAFNSSGEKPIVIVDGLEGKFLKEEHNLEKGRRLCWNFTYRPDIELLTPDELHRHVTTSFPLQPSPFELDQDVKLLLYACIVKTLEQLTPADTVKLSPHHQKYVTWMQREREKLDSHGPMTAAIDFRPYVDNKELYTELLDRLESQNKRGKFFATLARNLHPILKGEQDALQLMFQTPLVRDYYRELYKATNGLSKALAFIDLYAHKYPGINILEIGAGTGGMTKYVLDTLTQDGFGTPGAGTPRFTHYTYTDISAGFFSDAASLFEKFPDKVTFSVLDIEKDPLSQGFQEGVFDLIIADNVFHATQDLGTTVKHARKLLKPGGKLALFELTDPEVVRTNFAFGLLPGWWRYNDCYRTFSAGVSDSVWDSILRQGGFSGIDLNLRDYDDLVCHEHSALISTAEVTAVDASRPPRTLIVFDDSCSAQKIVCEKLLTVLKRSGVPETAALSLDEAVKLADLGRWFCIVILEVGDSFLRAMNEEQYRSLKTLLQADGGMLWVCKGGGVRPALPEHGLIQGAFRALRMEERHSKFISLSLEATTDPSWVTDRIVEVFHAVAVKPVNECEQEYIERDGNLCVDRFIEADYINRELEGMMADRQPGELRFVDHASLALSIASPGLLDSLEFVENDSPLLELEPGNIEIKVEVSGVNFRDCLIALGRIPGNSFGFECSGTVCRKGCEVHGLEIGDRVCASALGTYQTYTRCRGDDAILIPDTMSFTEAATIPVAFTTALYALVHVAHIQRGESILIHSAAGGTGQAAIQIALRSGAEIFATVGSEEKKSLLMSTYGIPEDHIFDSRSLSFAKGIGRMTAGKGVNIILNSLSGEFLVESWQCIAPFGRFLELGKKDILANESLPMLPFSKNASFHAIDLNEARKYQPELLQRLREDVKVLLAESAISPPQPIHVYTLGEVEKAFRYLQSGKNTGKTVVELRQDDVVKTNLRVKRSWQFDKNATYVIAGGLGGIGRSTASWMANRGAKNLVLLSRSGIIKEEARKLVESLRKQGTRVEAPICDIANYDSLKEALDSIGSSMPPIKGCIQSAMVLRNKVFGNMTHEDWTTSFDPKVPGTWNLHQLLPKGMDFFIMYSSIAGGVGGTASVNYSAACAYQDALAHYRNGLGEKATTLNLGVMVDDGVLRDNDTVRSALIGTGYLLDIRRKEMFALLEYHCNPSLEIPSTPLPSQVLVGIDIPSNIKASGAEVPIFMARPLFRGTWNITDADSKTQEEAAADVDKELVGIDSIEQAAEVIAQSLMHRISKALGLPLENLDSSKAMHMYGVDSLVAVELRNWFKSKLEAEVAVFEILGNSTFKDIGILVAGKSKLVSTMLTGKPPVSS